MKIIHLITGLGTGGAERALSNLLVAGMRDFEDIQVVSLTDEGRYGQYMRGLGIPVHALNMQYKRQMPLAYFKLRRLVKRCQPDVMHSWMYHANLLCAIAAQWRLPTVWGVRHSLQDIAREKKKTQLVIRGNASMSRAAGAIVYNSELAKSQHEAVGFCDSHSLVVPNGFDLDRWRPRSGARSEVRSWLGIPDHAPIVGHIARRHPMKDHVGYLRALVDVAYENPSAHFLLVGTGVLRSNVEWGSYLSELPAERMHFLGERFDIERLMAAFDILCLSSAWGEAFPNVLGEAMACCVPCISTDVGDSRNIIGTTGLTVRPSDSKALSRALNELLQISPDARAHLGQKARERVLANYSVETAHERHLDLYAALTQSGAS